MIECTLQEAIERCRDNGGRCRRHDLNECWVYVGGTGAVMYQENRHDAKFLAYDFETTWIYEPPKESAFQKWVESSLHYSLGSGVDTGRKEGWNAAIDAVLALKRNPARDLQDVNKIHPAVWCHEVKELKEP